MSSIDSSQFNNNSNLFSQKRLEATRESQTSINGNG